MESQLLHDVFDIPHEFHECAQWTEVPVTSSPINEKVCEKLERLVDGDAFLSRLRGPMFLINGASRNKRFYSKELWEKAIKNTENLRKKHQMLGTIGHDQPLDEDALLSGKATHIVTELWIDKIKHPKTGVMTEVGMGEILVINTSAGRELAAYLKAGVEFPVSSRAYGSTTGSKIEDADEMDPNTYMLVTFDFVRIPGVEIAVPSVVESAQNSNTGSDTEPPVTKSVKLLNNEPKMESTTMTANTDFVEQLERVSRDKAALENDLEAALNKLKAAESSAQLAEHLKTKAEEEASAVKKALADENEKLQNELQNVVEQLNSYRKLGEADELEQKLEALEHASKKLSEIDARLEELGSLDDIEACFSIVEDFKKQHGTFTEVTEKLEMLEAYQKLGTHEEMEKVLDLLEQYQELGSVQAIEQLMDVVEEQLEQKRAEEHLKTVRDFANKHKISESAAEKLLSKHSVDEAAEIIANFKVSPEVADRLDEGSAPAPEASESNKTAERLTNPVRATRIFESQTKM